jgi:signal transduction histidine kinase
VLNGGSQRATVQTQTSIGSQLLLLVVVVALPLLGLVFYSTYTAVQSQVEQSYMSASSLAELTAANVGQILTESEEVLAQLSQRPLVRAMDPQQCDPFLEEAAALFPRHIGIRVINASGQIICATGTAPESPLPSVADREWFQEISRTRSFTIGPVQQGRITGDWISALAYPILDDQGTFVGVISMPIDLIRFQAGLDAAHVVSGTITILDARGIVVARSQTLFPYQAEDIIVGRNLRGVPIVDKVLAEKEGQERSTGGHGDERLYGFTTVPAANWHVYSGIPAAEALRPVYKSLLQQGLLALAVIVLISILAYLLKNQIERPMQALEEVAQAVANGRLGRRTPLAGPKEFVEVAKQFNHMLDVQEQHTAQLEYHTRQLETLEQLGQAVTSTLDLPVLLNRMLAHVDALLTAEGISIWILKDHSFHCIAGSGLMAVGSAGKEHLSTGGVVQNIIRGDSLVNIRDINQEADKGDPFLQMAIHNDPPIRAIQAVPITLHGAVVGMVVAVHSQPAGLNEDDLHLLNAVTSWTAIAIGNARQHEQLRWLAHQVIAAQEEERKRLARELHDEAGQSLTALKFSLTLLHNDLPERSDNGASDPTYHERLQTAVHMVDAAMQQLRLLSHGLHPPMLTHFGLNLALQELCREFAGHTNLSINYRGDELPALPEIVSISFYRFLQEALTNVAKHAEANEVQVTLKFDGERLTLAVQDNGKGFDQRAAETSGRPEGIGLLGMHERFTRLGGEFTIHSVPGKGTRLLATYQVEQEKNPPASTEPVPA